MTGDCRRDRVQVPHDGDAARIRDPAVGLAVIIADPTVGQGDLDPVIEDLDALVG